MHSQHTLTLFLPNEVGNASDTNDYCIHIGVTLRK